MQPERHNDHHPTVSAHQPGALAPATHSLLEDAYAVLTGCSFALLGLILLKSAGLVTGGTAGIALLLSYLVPIPAGVLFTLVNIPFLLFACRQMERSFVVKAIVANLLISALALAAPLFFQVEKVNGLFAALIGGTIIGVGLLSLARHQTGLGGLGVLALMLQRSRGWNAGRTHFVGDALILLAAIPVLDMGAKHFALSVLSAVAVSAVLVVFHKPGRYNVC